MKQPKRIGPIETLLIEVIYLSLPSSLFLTRNERNTFTSKTPSLYQKCKLTRFNGTDYTVLLDHPF